WLLGVSVVVVRGRVEPPARSPVLSLFALPALYATWACLVLFFLAFGARFVLSLLALVWVADIAAYFAGRALGRRSWRRASVPARPSKARWPGFWPAWPGSP